jgi:hypothetical protein
MRNDVSESYFNFLKHSTRIGFIRSKVGKDGCEKSVVFVVADLSERMPENYVLARGNRRESRKPK